VRQGCVRGASEIQKVLACFRTFWETSAFFSTFWNVLACFRTYSSLTTVCLYLTAATIRQFSNSAIRQFESTTTCPCISIIHHTSYIRHHTSDHLPTVICQLPHGRPCISIIHPTSYIQHHTSAIIHHTSHIIHPP
jgi:hypothetical protein